MVWLKNFEGTAGSLAEVVAVEAFMDGDEHFRPQLTSISKKDPDAIFIAGYYTEAAKIAQQAAEQGIEAQILGADGFIPRYCYKLEEGNRGCHFYSSIFLQRSHPTVNLLSAIIRRLTGRTRHVCSTGI